MTRPDKPFPPPLPQPRPLPDAFLDRPIAHRALHGPGRPENSLSAVRAAVAATYGIEVDVQPSSDGVAMVFHDDRLDRLTGEEGPIAARSAEELGRLPLVGGDGEGIPTLAAVLAEVGGRVPLLVEIKDQDGELGPRVGALEGAVAEALDGYGGPVAVMSFNWHSVLLMKRLAPHVPRGMTTAAFDPEDWAPLPPIACERLREIGGYDQAGASFISHEALDLDRPRVRELKRQGAKVLCWTVRSPLEERLARIVADNVTFEGYRA